MKKVCIYDIGNCFVFSVEVNDESTVESIENSILDNKASALLLGDSLYYPYEKGTLTVILFHAYSRKAYDLYFRLKGSDMRSIDPFAVQRILYSMGVTDCKTPCIYELEPIQVIRKE